MKRVGVEKSLQNVKTFLSNEGYDVVEFENNNSDIRNLDAVVVTGQSNNFLGMQNTTTKAPVISADGCTPEDIKNQLTNTFS
ncbi:YkuS family protein [Anaeromicrobium sediminis]|uniref:YkuS family protein n=1 Tax=Anaeromicrobium sediminis TaxID=1478221 RepID=A0A267MJZ5_9FIRM|nr:YkuS family protein [Anaeromicrobium sediminis]PAB59205.1 hypothetical protein CCE28_11850 [Anaeromicrobium sediminis]